MNPGAPNLNQLWANLLVEELIRSGIDYFCLAPGSRCAPLTTAIASSSRARNILHFDERGAAFHALGYGRATGQPAVMITTSGTAVANVWPAVVEASEDRIPLIVLTADRPPELHDAGANQTIDQVKIFGPYVRWQKDLPCPTTEIGPETILTTVDQALHRSRCSPQGPVHLNCMFREPLAPASSGEDYGNYLSDLARWEKSGKPYTTYAPPTQMASANSLLDLAQMLNSAARGLLVVGALRDGVVSEAVRRLSDKLGWPLLPDIASGLRLGVNSTHTIAYYDHIIAASRFASAHAPDIVLHLGGRLTSRRLLEYIEGSRPSAYIIVDDHPFRYDPAHLATLKVQASVDSFYETLSSRLTPRVCSPWLEDWRRATRLVDEVLTNFPTRSPTLSEPLVARLVSQEIGAERGLFLGSSMPVRDMNHFGALGGPSIRVAANRGASGIGGTVASATGFARGLNHGVTLLIGDLALLHDLNSLSLTRSLDAPMTLVVLNNNGGGIFSFLPIAQFEDIFERYFGTPHNLDFEGAARMFGLEYVRPSSKFAFVEAYRAAAKKQQSTLIEVVTQRKENYDLHIALQREISAKLSSA
ncbi:MAG: 2-succinyl-5-enolpyruvyl-6-hydroxy-3-cyclohexene-1-carboxylic-acid synthase [Deltaproteobacteria bacterium]|nr:MAG: 2-succinyl-5-enolpyruvyl-6-hydroxy-3-cyclohexene-1-carboxylic-acid synthase [Deltaproteobacteria bacterium]